jgi:hypothetical protein
MRASSAGIAAVAIIASLPAISQDDRVVQLKDDPYRRVVLENSAVRIWEVKVPVGESTPFHEHRTDQVSVRINTTTLTNVPKGGLFSFTRDFALESGSVSYGDYTKSGSYVHKITPKGNAHHVIEAEILAPPPADDRRIADERPGSTTLLDNARLRAVRLVVEPGKSVEVAPHGKTFVVALKTARVEWYGEPGARPIRNDGPTAIELVEVQVK